MVFRKRRRSAILFCVPILGCLNTDFGRVRQSLVIDDIHAWIGREAAATHNIPPSEFRLSDDERLLRDLAYPLIEPPYDRQRWYSVLNEYGLTRFFRGEWWAYDRTAYAAHLFSPFVRSASGLYAQLTDDIRNDVERIGPFFAAARRVSDLDRKREKSLAYIADLRPDEQANALRRVAENSLTIVWVHNSLSARAAAYRYALERLVIVVPSEKAVNAERSLTLLKMRIAESNPAPAQPVAIAAAPNPALVTKH